MSWVTDASACTETRTDTRVRRSQYWANNYIAARIVFLALRWLFLEWSFLTFLRKIPIFASLTSNLWERIVDPFAPPVNCQDCFEGHWHEDWWQLAAIAKTCSVVLHPDIAHVTSPEVVGFLWFPGCATHTGMQDHRVVCHNPLPTTKVCVCACVRLFDLKGFTYHVIHLLCQCSFPSCSNTKVASKLTFGTTTHQKIQVAQKKQCACVYGVCVCAFYCCPHRTDIPYPLSAAFFSPPDVHFVFAIVSGSQCIHLRHNQLPYRVIHQPLLL